MTEITKQSQRHLFFEFETAWIWLYPVFDNVYRPDVTNGFTWIYRSYKETKIVFLYLLIHPYNDLFKVSTTSPLHSLGLKCSSRP